MQGHKGQEKHKEAAALFQKPGFDPEGLEVIDETQEDDPTCPGVKIRIIRYTTGLNMQGKYLAEWLERLHDCQYQSQNSPGFDPAFSDTAKSERRQMEQC